MKKIKKAMSIVFALLILSIWSSLNSASQEYTCDIEAYLNQFTWTVYFENVTEGKRIERYKTIQFRKGEIFNRFGNRRLGSYQIESNVFILDFDNFQGIILSYFSNSAAIHGFKGYGFKQFDLIFLNVDTIMIRGNKIE